MCYEINKSNVLGFQQNTLRLTH